MVALSLRPARTCRVASGAGSCPRQFQAAGDPSANDVASAPQGDATTSDFVPGTTDQVLQNWPAVAVVRVVSRASARYDSTADQSTAQAPGRGHGSGGTVRPTQFAVERRLKGDPPDCLTLDVPGGTAIW